MSYTTPLADIIQELDAKPRSIPVLAHKEKLQGHVYTLLMNESDRAGDYIRTACENLFRKRHLDAAALNSASMFLEQCLAERGTYDNPGMLKEVLNAGKQLGGDRLKTLLELSLKRLTRPKFKPARDVALPVLLGQQIGQEKGHAINALGLCADLIFIDQTSPDMIEGWKWVVSELVNGGVDINGDDQHGKSPLMVACESYDAYIQTKGQSTHFAAIDLLIEAGADWAKTMKSLTTSLQASAVIQRNPQVRKAMLEGVISEDRAEGPGHKRPHF